MFQFDEAPLHPEDQGRPAKPTRLFVGLHYLKHAKDLSDEEVVAKTRVGNRGKKKKPPALRKWLKRRTGIAPVIGHMKNHGRLGRNYLLGVEDGSMNVILCEAGHNIRKLLRAFLIVSFFAAVQNLFSIRQRIKNPPIFT